MSKATDETRREYYKQWRAKNKDKIRKYNILYWERKALREQMQEKEKGENGNNEKISDD